MEAVTAIGLLSGIFSFITFGKDLVKGAIEVHNSLDGVLEGNRNRESVVEEMRRLAVSLQPPDSSKLAGEDKGLCDLAQRCHQLAEELACALAEVKAKDSTSKFQSFWAAAKAKLREKHIEDVEQRLDQCSQQLHVHLTLLTRLASLVQLPLHTIY